MILNNIDNKNRLLFSLLLWDQDQLLLSSSYVVPGRVVVGFRRGLAGFFSHRRCENEMFMNKALTPVNK